MKKLTRRDFLKLTAAFPAAAALSGVRAEGWPAPQAQSGSLPNVIVLVLDAMSARNLSVYGYHRQTTPQFERFAERATVYHSHYSAGNFTTPGTASLLTGTYPWTHRAVNMSGLIARDRAGQNLFHAVGDAYKRVAFSQNLWPNYLFGQFEQDIDRVLSPASFSEVEQLVGDVFPRDSDAGFRAFDDFMFQDGRPPASLVFGSLARLWLRRQAVLAPSDDYPRGIPRTGNYPIYFKLARVFDGVKSEVAGSPPPFFAYFHLWCPHAPYKPHKDFVDLFLDNWRPENKPAHRLGDALPNSRLNTRRKGYDEYIANVDFEFGRLLDAFDRSGILENSYLMVTSDHGESFERGVDGHITPLLYDPLVHVPLLVSAPGQRTRKDVRAPTNSVDVLPTLARIAGRPAPDWAEGELLPGLGGNEDLERSSFSVEAKSNPAFGALKQATIALRKGPYKLIHYTGYEPQDSFELYDLESDPEEVNDLFPAAPAVAKSMSAELLERFHRAAGPLG